MGKNNINDKLVMGARNLSEVLTWIYAAYDVHGNMRIHTCGAMPIGYSTIHGKVLKHKINVNSLTEEELVGFSEYITYNLWLMMFMEDQRYGIKDNINSQENKVLFSWKGMEGIHELVTQDILTFTISL